MVLSGPAGSGKSTTVLSLAKECGIQVVEWINPVDEAKLTTQNEGPPHQRSSSPTAVPIVPPFEGIIASLTRCVDIESLSRKFSTFLLHSQRYGSLDSPPPSTSDPRKQLILIQDLPNTTMGSTTSLAHSKSLFLSSLQQILVSPRAKYPVVLIVTESEISSFDDVGYGSGFRGDGLSVRSVLGDEILSHPATSHIMYPPHPFLLVLPSFNPPACTLVVNLPSSLL